MAHVKVVDRCEEGKPTPIPPDAKITAHSFHNRVRTRLPTNQGTTLRRQDCPDRAGLSCIGSRVVIRSGGGGNNTHFSPKEEYRLGHHDRRIRVHY